MKTEDPSTTTSEAGDYFRKDAEQRRQQLDEAETEAFMILGQDSYSVVAEAGEDLPPALQQLFENTQRLANAVVLLCQYARLATGESPYGRPKGKEPTGNGDC